MLNRQELKNYRILRGLTQKDVAKYCDISNNMISMIEDGKRNLTEDSYKEIVKGINLAYQAKKDGLLNKPKPLKNAVKVEKRTQKKKTETEEQ